MTRVTLYGKAGCHLCDEAREAVSEVRAERGFELEEVDVALDPVLHRRYGERIPVIAIDGNEELELVVDADALRERLDKVAPVSFREPVGGGVELQDGASERLSLGVAARLSRYLQVLTQAKKMGKETISSQELADYTHVNSTQIRRDLSGFGKFGKRGVGYNVDSLVSQIRKILHTTGKHNLALFGAGHLGQAIAGSDIFADHGFRVVAVFDTDPEKIGKQVSDTLTVRPYDDLERVVLEEEVVVGVLAVPTEAAQKVADDLVEAGVRIIFNYSEALLQVPPEVTVHTSSPAVDLLYALYFYLT